MVWRTGYDGEGDCMVKGEVVGGRDLIVDVLEEQ